MVTGSGAMRGDPGAPGAARQRLMGARPAGDGSWGGWHSPARPGPAPGVQQPRGSDSPTEPPCASRGRSEAPQAAGRRDSPSGSPWSRSGFRTVPPGCARSPSWLRPAVPPPSPAVRGAVAPGGALWAPLPPAARPAAAPARHRPRHGGATPPAARHQPGHCPRRQRGSPGGSSCPSGTSRPWSAAHPKPGSANRHLHPRVAAGLLRRLLRLLFRVPLPRPAPTSQPLLQNSS